MTLRRSRIAAAGVVVCAGLLSVAACSSGGRGASPSSTTHRDSPSPSATSQAGATVTATATVSSPPSGAQPSFSPASITIVTRAMSGKDVVLGVKAPPSTRFGIGKAFRVRLQCRSVVVTPGDPTTYRVVCPQGEAGSQLISTISYGAFDYGFMKPL